MAEATEPHSVTFYVLEKNKNQDCSESGAGSPLVLMAGQKYDFATCILVE
jgi:hypothetical protein